MFIGSPPLFILYINFIINKETKELIIEDENGNVNRKIKKDIFGNFIIEDEHNRTIRKIRKNNFDRIEVLDENQRVILKMATDAMEDIEIHPTNREIFNLDDFFVNSFIRKIISEKR